MTDIKGTEVKIGDTVAYVYGRAGHLFLGTVRGVYPGRYDEEWCVVECLNKENGVVKDVRPCRVLIL